MRMYFIPRRPLLTVSMLAVLAALVVAARFLTTDRQLAAWVAAGSSGLSPVISCGQNANAVSLLVSVEDENTADEVAAMLAVLADNGARATFFISGGFAADNPDTLLSIKAGGHMLGVLGRADGADYAAALSEMNETAAAIADAVGAAPLVYLPAGGVAGEAARRAAMDSGLMFVLGSVDSGDWQAEAAENIIAKVLAQIEPGSFITLGPGDKTCAALKVLLPEFAAKGLACCTVDKTVTADGE